MTKDPGGIKEKIDKFNYINKSTWGKKHHRHLAN